MTTDGKKRANTQTLSSSPLPTHVPMPRYNVMQAAFNRSTPEQAVAVSQRPRSGPQHRVRKLQNSRAQTVAHNALTVPPSSQGRTAAPASNNVHRPSDEDLLMLVMRRQRMRDEDVARLKDANHRLEEEHSQLQSKHKACHQKLQKVTQQWHASVQDHHIQEAQIRAFREKYAKIKQWAQDMSKEYEGLRADGDKLGQEVQAARTDGDRGASERIELLEKCDAAIGQIGAIKSNVAEIRAESMKLASTEERLAREQGLLREEKLRNQSHAFYIERLESTQRSMNSYFNRKQDEMVVELTKVATLVKEQHDDGLSTALSQVVEAVEQLRQHDTTGSSHQEELQTMLASIRQHYEDSKKFLHVVKDAQVDWHAASDLQYSSLVDAVDKLKPDLLRLQTLETDSSRLSARLKEAETSLKLADHEKRTAQLFCSGLLQAHKELARDRSQPDAKTIEVRANQLRDANGRLLVELQSNKKEVAHLQNELSKTQELSNALRSELNEQNDKQKAELERAQEQWSSTASARIGELNTKLSTQAADMTAKQDELLQSLEALHSKIREQQQSNNRLGQLLRESDTRMADKAEDLAKLQAEKDQLEQYLSPFKDMEDRFSRLQQKCKDYDMLAKQLTQAQADHVSSEKNAAEAGARATNLEKSLEEAKQQLQALEPLPREINSLQRKSSLQISQIKELSDARRDLKHQLQQLPELQKSFANSVSRIRELEEELKAAQDSATEVAQLRDQLKELQCQKDEVSKARTKLTEKDSAIHELRQQVSILKLAKSEVARTTEESQQKDVEMAAMQDYINKLEEESRKFDLVREHITDEEIATFSEHTILSFKSIIHQSQLLRPEVNEDNHRENNEVSFATSRLAVNREACDDSADAFVVPDSQSQGHLQYTSTSELSSPPEFFDDMPSMFDTNEALEGTFGTVTEDTVGPSPAVATQKRGQDQPDLRPGTSNDEMLLLSSDAADSSPAGRDPKSAQAQVLIPASAHRTSPMKTRTGKQVDHSRDSTPQSQIHPTNENIVNLSSPRTHPREHHAPNSAAKRRAEAPETTAKRPKADMKRLATRQSTTPKATRFSGADTIYEAPSSSRKSGSISGTSALTTGRNGRRPNTTLRKGGKQSRYAERFSQADQV